MRSMPHRCHLGKAQSSCVRSPTVAHNLSLPRLSLCVAAVIVEAALATACGCSMPSAVALALYWVVACAGSIGRDGKANSYAFDKPAEVSILGVSF